MTLCSRVEWYFYTVTSASAPNFLQQIFQEKKQNKFSISRCPIATLHRNAHHQPE